MSNWGTFIKLYRDRKYTHGYLGCKGLREMAEGMTALGYEVSFGMMKMFSNSGDSCTILWIY